MKFPSLEKNREKIYLLVFLVIFFMFGIFLILTIETGIAPDEEYHIKAANIFSRTPFLPENTPESYSLRDITRIPYVSFWINARLLNLNFLNIEDYILLRFFNLIISTVSLFVVYLLSREIINKKLFNVIPVFLLSNTLMYIFLSASVSYDNLSKLFLFLTFLFFIKFFKNNKPSSLLYLTIFQSLALLTKITTAPVVFIELILLLVIVIKRKNLKDMFLSAFKNHKILFIITAILAALVLQLYGGNLIKYGNIQVSCEKILTVEQCKENQIYLRNYNLEESIINDFSDLSDTLKMRMSPFEYISSWIMEMTEQTYGIFGHEAVKTKPYFANVYIFLFALLSLIALRKWKKKDVIEAYLFLISLFYTLVLMFYQNFLTYLRWDIFVLSIHGRYIFPVLPILYILFIKYLSQIKTKWFRNTLLFLLYLTFLLGCIPFYFIEVWVRWNT
jgi:hypothetical protein